MTLREDADYIIKNTLEEALPDRTVKEALAKEKLGDKIYLLAIGKAAWQMAKTAKEVLGDKIVDGIVITKYDHVKDAIKGIRCYEAGHPIPDENSVKVTEEAIKMCENLSSEDRVLFLISGGGSALFESPLVELSELSDITKIFLASGADITEINTVRKHLSAVKGGKFAQICEPAKIFSIIISDVLGDPLDMIASGPAYPDKTTSKDALEVIKKYDVKISDKVANALMIETPKGLTNVKTVINGSVKTLCASAEKYAKKLGYKTIILSDCLFLEAREAGSFFASIAKTYENSKENIAFIAGGETIVRLTGLGKGGRNQELALSAAEGIGGIKNVAIFSVGSDGTDGPTDAAGGYVDGLSKEHLKNKGVDIYSVLKDNDAYSALEKAGGLIITGPTGTNLNDFTVLLIKKG